MIKKTFFACNTACKFLICSAPVLQIKTAGGFQTVKEVLLGCVFSPVPARVPLLCVPQLGDAAGAQRHLLRTEPDPRDTRSRSSKRTYSSGAAKKHLLWSPKGARITVRQDSHADGKSRSCFCHSFFKQQAASRGCLCREQKKKKMCFPILMDKKGI